MKWCLFLLFMFVVVLSNSAEKKYWNIYDPDSLVVVALLDSNTIPHFYFQDVMWMVTQETLNDSDWRIARLLLRPQVLPKNLYCLPPEIGNLNRLSWLEVAHHDLERLPVEIADIEWMQVLDFRYNPLKEIPAELAQCSKLAYLGLAQTDITSMPDEFLDLDSLRPCNIAVDTINGNIYPRNVIDLCGLENFTLTEKQKVWADVADYEEYKQKYCQETAVQEPEYVVKKPAPSGIHVSAAGYSIRLTLEREGRVSLSLFNSAGKRVARVIRRKVLSKGCHTIPFSKNISPGVYFLRGKFNGVGFSERVVITGGI